VAFGDYNYKLEIYNIANTIKQCEFVRSDLLSGEVVQEVCGEESLTFQIPRSHANFGYLAKFRVVRLYDTDLSSYNCYRIKRIKTWRERRKVLAEIYCEHLKYDLADRVIPEEKHFIQESPQTILDFILGFSDSFTRGVCPAIPVIDFDICYQTCLDAIKDLADATGFDYVVTAGAAPFYKVVYIMTMGLDSVTISYGENLKTITCQENVETDFATRVIAKGGSALVDQRKLDSGVIGLVKPGIMNVAGATFIIKSWDPSGYWLKVTSKKMVSAGDALNGMYVLLNNELVMIIDSDKASDGDRVRLDSAPPGTISAGDRIYIFKSESDLADYVPDLGLEAGGTYQRTEAILNVDDLPDVLNVAGPEGYSDLSGAYSSGVCQGWEAVEGASCSENTDTDYIRTGTKSQKVICSADGDGIKRSVNCGQAEVASFYIWVYVESIATGAKLKVRLKVGDGETDYFPQNADSGEDEAFIETTGWRQIIAEGGVFDTTGEHDLEILAVDGAVTFYLDSVMVQCSEYITEEDVFYAWDTRVLLWEKAVTELTSLAVPTVKYDLDIIDLYEADRDEYSLRQITAGTDVEIVDAGLGLTGDPIRTKRKTWNLLRPWEARLEVSS
jgi:phage minor structural protein